MIRNPDISVVIPVRNEADKIEACLQGILRQSIPVREIIVIDSGSQDGTQDIVRKFPKTLLIEIEPETFNHGATRNVGWQHASGEYIVYTVGDARPVDEHWLAYLIEGFIDDEVVAVCGQQVVPHEMDKNPIQWFRPISEPKLQSFQFGPEAFDALSPQQKKEICGWDDVTACYRREALIAIPFRKINFAEDAAWAMDALRAGFKIVYNTAARVYHYHTEEPDFAFRRTLTVCYHRYKFFGYISKPSNLSFKRKLSMIKTLVKTNISWRKKKSWWNYNLSHRKASNTAIKLFLDAVAKGERHLEDMHEKYCKQAPQPSA